MGPGTAWITRPKIVPPGRRRSGAGFCGPPTTWMGRHHEHRNRRSPSSPEGLGRPGCPFRWSGRRLGADRGNNSSGGLGKALRHGKRRQPKPHIRRASDTGKDRVCGIWSLPISGQAYPRDNGLQSAMFAPTGVPESIAHCKLSVGFSPDLSRGMGCRVAAFPSHSTQTAKV